MRYTRKWNGESLLPINKDYEIFYGFDNDETGDILGNKMIRLFPTVKRLRPTNHDWNEILVSRYIIF